MDYTTNLPRDLTLLNKVPARIRGIRIMNKETGEIIETDSRTMRLNRMRKRIFAWAEVQKDMMSSGLYRMVMITLTYREIDDWRPNQIRDYVKCLKRKLGSKCLAVAWVGELQKRGAVHYHLILICEKGSRIPLPDRSGMWKWGISKIETARTPFYLVSYTKKAYQKEGVFPKGMRMFSIWVSSSWISIVSKWFLRTSGLPEWFRKELLSRAVDLPAWSRCPGGGYTIEDELFKSPYKVFIMP